MKPGRGGRGGSYSTPPIPCCRGNEQRAGKFDGNYLAGSLYNVDAGDVRGGGIILWLNFEIAYLM